MAPKHSDDIHLSPQILASSAGDAAAVLQQLQTSREGLTSGEASNRLQEYGPNVVAQDKQHTRWRLLGRALLNPLVVFLSVLAIISASTGDFRAAVVMALMVVLGVVLRFVQETRAHRAVFIFPPAI
jgi:P-type Mg2+ transporter